MEYLKHTISGLNPLAKNTIRAIPQRKYRSTHTKDQRITKYGQVMEKSTNPLQIPVIIERGCISDGLPDIDKPINLIPKTVTFAELHGIIKGKINPKFPYQTFYILVNGTFPPNPSNTLQSAYDDPNLKSDDGFLYIEVFSQNTFG